MTPNDFPVFKRMLCPLHDLTKVRQNKKQEASALMALVKNWEKNVCELLGSFAVKN